MSAVATDKQRLLARTLYRGLVRWCRIAPTNASLGHLGHWVGGIHIDSPNTLQEVLRQTFRHGDSKHDLQASLQEAFDGMRLLHTLSFDDLPRTQSTSEPAAATTTMTMASMLPPQDWVNSVEWLPPISDCQDTLVDESHLPMFPLSGPIFQDDGEDSTNLAMFSQLPDVPMEGMEIPLRIFEPRYRQLYRDILANGTKRFVVPFSHPSLPGQFAHMGWLYEIVRVEDIADQTNGQIAMLCHHLVTKPVRIERIVNPADWTTRFTYLRVQATIQEEHLSWEKKDMQDLDTLLRTIKQEQPKHSHLVDKMLTALAEDNLWSLVNVLVTHLQMTVLSLRVEIAGKIQEQHKIGGVTTMATVREAQKPYREEMESLLLEISTLVPILLQESPKEQCERMHQRIQHHLQAVPRYSQSNISSKLETSS